MGKDITGMTWPQFGKDITGMMDGHSLVKISLE